MTRYLPAAVFFWERHPSIYEHVVAHLRGGLPLDAPLPDEGQVVAQSGLAWVPGASDGVYAHHVGTGRAAHEAAVLANRLWLACHEPAPEHRQEVYRFTVEHSVIGYVDRLLELVAENPDLDRVCLHDLASALAVASPDREPTKLGIALLGLFRRDSDRDLLATLARHEEFTLYGASALANIPATSEQDLWALARQVHGWGRIATVERLAGTGDPQIQNWLLREGYKNVVMVEYLAFLCATRGRLAEALAADPVDADLLNAAGDLIAALLRGGPAKGMPDYAGGPAVVERYLHHLQPHVPTVRAFSVVSALEEWLGAPHPQGPVGTAQPWGPDTCARLRARCAQITGQAGWRDRVLAALESQDEESFAAAAGAAPRLGIDPWDFHWRRLEGAPRDPDRWVPIMHTCDETRISRVLQLAQRELLVPALATGPGHEIGFGPGHQIHRCLDHLLQGLGRFPGRGAEWVLAGLDSPVIHNRYAALQVLAQWGKPQRPASITAAVQEALGREPEEGVRAAMRRVLEGPPEETPEPRRTLSTGG